MLWKHKSVKLYSSNICTYTVMWCVCVTMVMILMYYYYIIQWQQTPLHWAAGSGHTDSVALLVASGADINMKTDVS